MYVLVPPWFLYYIDAIRLLLPNKYVLLVSITVLAAVEAIKSTISSIIAYYRKKTLGGTTRGKALLVAITI